MDFLIAQIREALDPVVSSTLGRGDNAYLVVAMMVFCVVIGGGLITFIFKLDRSNKDTQEKLLDRFGAVIETQRREFTAELQAEREERATSRGILIEHDLFQRQSHSDLLSTIKELETSVSTLSEQIRDSKTKA